MRRLTLPVGTTIVVLLALVTNSLDAQSTWTGAVSASWSTGGNWSGVVPTSTVDVTIPAGTPNAPSTASVANATCRNLTIAGGASMTLAAGFPLTATGVVTVSGTVAGGGLLRLGGSSVIDVTASNPMTASLEIAKSSGGSARIASNVTVAGNLTVTSGDLTVSIGQFTLTVGGNATFQGGTLNVSSIGTIDVAGNVTFSGTTASGNCPSIQCGGNWTSDAGYGASSITNVTFDKVGAQTISAVTLPSVTIAATSSASASSLHTTAGMVVNGALSVSPGSLDVDDNFTLASGGSLTLGNATNTFGGAVTLSGALAGSGTIVMDGSTVRDLVASVPLPGLQISKTSGGSARIASNVTVTGNLTQTSGDLTVSIGAFTLTVGGNATFQGGTLSVSNIGTIDVAGNVTFSGTSASGNCPSIQCGGNWTSDASYAPTPNASVTFDKVGAQTIAAITLPSVTIAATSNASASALHTTAGLAVNGALSVSPGSLDVDDNFTLASGGSLTLGNATNTFGGAVTLSGTLAGSGTIVMDGSTVRDLVASVPLPGLQISKTSGGSARIASNVTVTGNLTQTSGDLTVSIGAFTLTVGGNATFQGGTLSVSNIGTIDVAGNVAFSGTSVSGNAPTIQCAGNFSADAAFAPTGGLVELDGVGSTAIASATAGGTVRFASVVIKNGTRAPSNDFTLAAGSTTVDATGSLTVATGRHLSVHSLAANAVNVNGALSVAANGELSLGPQTTLTVGSGGTLSLVGAAGQPSKITGAAGGGYALAVNGTLAANNFLVKEMGTAGMVVGLGATIAAAPNNLRNGTFDFRSGAPAGSVLLDLRRQAPATDFDALTFLNTPAAPGVFNVQTAASGVPIGFTNFAGSFSGPSFENDPNGLIGWNQLPAPPVGLFRVRIGAELLEVLWTSTNSANIASYEVRHAFAATGPFTLVTTQGVGPTGNGFVDTPLAANVPVWEGVWAVMTNGERTLFGVDVQTPYSAAPPPNVYKVGGNGPYATIQAAINAATLPNSVVWVTPGNYAAFSINSSAPLNVHVASDGTGPVNVDTSSGPITISNIPAGHGVELGGLNVGSASTAQAGVQVTNCAGVVVLDALAVACDASQTAVAVSGSQKVAVQRCTISGGTGLLLNNGSHLGLSKGSLSSLTSTGSTIELADLIPGSMNVTPAGSIQTRGGVMPNLVVPRFASMAHPQVLTIDAFPNCVYIPVASSTMSFNSIAPFEMPIIVDPGNYFTLSPQMTDAAGHGVTPFEIEPFVALLGFTYVSQVACLDPVTSTWRLSNMVTVTSMP